MYNLSSEIVLKNEPKLIKGIEVVKIFEGVDYKFYLSKDGETLFRENCNNNDSVNDGLFRKFNRTKMPRVNYDETRKKGILSEGIQIQKGNRILKSLCKVEEKKDKNSNAVFMGYTLHMLDENKDKIFRFYAKG